MSEATRRQMRAVTRKALSQLAGTTEDFTEHEQALAALADMDRQTAPPWRGTIWDRQVQPGLWVVVEDSGNILVQLTEPTSGVVVARSGPLSWTQLSEALAEAHVAQVVAADQADEDRRQGLAEVMAERRQARLPGPHPPGTRRLEP